MKPLVHLLVGSNLTACGKRGWGLSDSEGATTDTSIVNCYVCEKTGTYSQHLARAVESETEQVDQLLAERVQTLATMEELADVKEVA